MHTWELCGIPHTGVRKKLYSLLPQGWEKGMSKNNMTVARVAVTISVLLLFGTIALAQTSSSTTYAEIQLSSSLDLNQQSTPVSGDRPVPAITPGNIQHIVEQGRLGKGTVTAMAWSPDDQLLAVGGSLGVWLYGLEDLEEPLYLLEQHRLPVTSIAWSVDGTLLASGSEDSLQIWNMTSGEPVLQATSVGVQAVAWSPHGSILATIDNDGSIHVRDVAAQQILFTIDEYQDALSLSWSPFGTVIASGGNDGRIRLWDAATGRSLRVIDNNRDRAAITSIDWIPEGDLIAAGDRNGTVTLWNASNSSLLYELEGHSAAVVDTKWSPDGTVLLTASRDSTIVIWDAITRLPLQALTAHTHDVVSAVWSSEGARLISASRDGAVLLWDTASSATDTGPSMQVAQAFLVPCFSQMQSLMVTSAQK